MNLIQSQDRVLLAGLAVALVVVFARPIQYLLDVAADAQRASGLALVPALVILTAVFIYEQQSKRQQAKARAQTAEAEARQAQARAEEMERLVTFGQSLARSLDLDALREVVRQQMPALASATAASLGADGQLSLTMTPGSEPVAVPLAPDAGARSDAGNPTLAAAATLLGISVRNAQLFRDVKEHSMRDGLTGLFNRTHAGEVLDTELRRARRSQSPLSLIMFDLDHFKEINDRHGHLCGDAVLAAVGGRMREVLRGSDVKCRYGGEEFLVLLPDTPLDGARRVAESLRRELAALPIRWNDGDIMITASFGVTTALPSEISADAFIGRADAALYRAKDQGRNCVRLSLEAAVA